MRNDLQNSAAAISSDNLPDLSGLPFSDFWAPEPESRGDWESTAAEMAREIQEGIAGNARYNDGHALEWGDTPEQAAENAAAEYIDGDEYNSPGDELDSDRAEAVRRVADWLRPYYNYRDAIGAELARLATSRADGKGGLLWHDMDGDEMPSDNDRHGRPIVFTEAHEGNLDMPIRGRLYHAGDLGGTVGYYADDLCIETIAPAVVIFDNGDHAPATFERDAGCLCVRLDGLDTYSSEIGFDLAAVIEHDGMPPEIRRAAHRLAEDMADQMRDHSAA